MVDAAHPRPDTAPIEIPNVEPDRVAPVLDKIVDIFASVADDIRPGLSSRNGFSQAQCVQLNTLCTGVIDLVHQLNGNELYRVLGRLEMNFLGRLSPESALKLSCIVSQYVAGFGRIERDEMLATLQPRDKTRDQINNAMSE